MSDRYTASGAVNWSTLKHLSKSERAYVHALSHPLPETPAMRVGTLCHLAVLEPDKFARVVSFDGERRGAAWQRFQEANPGATVCSVSEYTTAASVAAAVQEHSVARDIIRRAWAKEAEIFATICGVECKGRLDGYGDGFRLDLKTGPVSCHPREWQNHARRMQYHCQDAMYSMLAQAAGLVLPTGYLVACETKPPYEVCVYRVSPDVEELGRAIVTDLLTRLKQLRERGMKAEFGYPAAVDMTFPSWAYGYEGDALEGVVE